ncbi:MAG: glycosyltransferase [Nitrospirota bacterium]|nr:glycosyltransferase [Nitrospirota bacterium]
MNNNHPGRSAEQPLRFHRYTTYNSAKTLAPCLESIINQDYRGEIEVIIADGGSTDSTLDIAQKYTYKIYPNPLKTGEAGKAAGVEL